jgi:hypothetical protein
MSMQAGPLCEFLMPENGAGKGDRRDVKQLAPGGRDNRSGSRFSHLLSSHNSDSTLFQAAGRICFQRH